MYLPYRIQLFHVYWNNVDQHHLTQSRQDVIIENRLITPPS